MEACMGIVAYSVRMNKRTGNLNTRHLTTYKLEGKNAQG